MSPKLTEGVGLTLAQSGYWQVDLPVVSRSNLQGDPSCLAAATHYIRVAAVGAYEAYRDELQEFDAQGGFLSMGARVGTAQGHSSFTRAGDINACFAGHMPLCSAPLRFRVAPIAPAGAGVQCPDRQVSDGRGGCVEYIGPWATFLLSVGIEGRCRDGAGPCEYNLEVKVGNRQVDYIEGPQDAGRMAPTPVSKLIRAANWTKA